MNKIRVYYGLFNGGDGSAFIRWYLTEENAQEAEQSQYEGWGDACDGSIETFEGSDVHLKAIKNSEEFEKEKKEKI